METYTINEKALICCLFLRFLIKLSFSQLYAYSSNLQIAHNIFENKKQNRMNSYALN